MTTIAAQWSLSAGFLRNEADAEGSTNSGRRLAVARVPAGEIEGGVLAQVRALLRQPEIVVGTWQAARDTATGVSEPEVRVALERIEPLWDELFHAEQTRFVRLLVERIDVRASGAAVRLRLDGLGSLVRDLAAKAGDAGRMAA
ncbi:hypothetical protein [Elioraea sp.]|uniref:hypothetical protein n=1 Tax=Elioraea sp. TaxID=2185103 RepID=UPI0025C39A21|nr:hypothetical protein [Elioraea sp.]